MPNILRLSNPWLIALTTLCAAGLLSAIHQRSYGQGSGVEPTPPWPQTPLHLSQSAAPLVMLVASRDHRLFYEAYNDAMDLDGDGSIDMRFKPQITYVGLFNSGYCYAYSGSGNSGIFTPVGLAAADGSCSGQWSGNWLNYVTTSRMDALRVILYGGHREVDTATDTILRRSYIPQDAHSWAKEYTSPSVDGYDITRYTPLSLPTSGRRHFFGNLTASANTDCSTPGNCSDSLPPLLRVALNSSKRVWEWASKERPVLDGNHGGSSSADYTVRVRVCSAGYTAGCKQYPAGNYKPIGLLHEYGETNNLRFGLMTGSYNKNLSGGVLRKNISDFKLEIDPNNGTFTSGATIVQTFYRIRIRDYNNGRTDQAYRSGWNAAGRMMTEGEYVDWGNPLGEMMYEAVRYFANKGSPTPAYNTTSGGHDQALGLPSVSSWSDPFVTSGAARCSRAFNLVLSDIYPSFDSDQIPGSAFTSFSGDLSGFNATNEANIISSHEGSIGGLRFIGQAGTASDGTPSPKNVTTLSNVRGLAPEEPGKQGSYYTASVASWARRNDIRPDLAGVQNVYSYFVALASPLPTIRIPTGSGSNLRYITIVPFAKTVGPSSWVSSFAKGSFQPTNQIVDFYIDTIANVGGFPSSPSINGGRPYYKFRISFEDVEWGGDHDMDAVSEYEVFLNADGTASVRVTPIYQAGGMYQNMGYVISGTTRDGVYLVVSDEATPNIPYYLNVPPGRSAGYCDPAPAASSDPRWNECSNLPRLGGTPNSSTQIFAAGASAASFLRDPLWYAAKWGAFDDTNGNNVPDIDMEWDANNDGIPDAYFLVQNPSRLRDALRRALDEILASATPSVGGAASSGFVDAGALYYQTSVDPGSWSGDLAAYRLSDLTRGLTTSPVWQASHALPHFSSRSIWTSYNGIKTSFTWSALPAGAQAALGSETVVRYVRGDRTLELRSGGSLRNRPINNILGTFVHGGAEYIPENGHVCAASNGGMLHCFNGSTGQETFAYIPNSAIPRLHLLTRVDYNHVYIVDGPVVVTTRAQTRSTVWATGKNILIGTPGRGGRGLFALDVTNPGSFGAANILWDHTAAIDSDLGYILGEPVVTRARNGDVVVISGNGYASQSGKSVLYVFRLHDGALLKKIDLGGTATGLGSPTLVDTDRDGYHDYAYIADLSGRVWKIDIRNPNPALWDSFYKSGSTPIPLFTATSPSGGSAQPITARLSVSVIRDPASPFNGRPLIIFGTGSYLTASDISNNNVQTLYGLIDYTFSTTSGIVGRSSLIQVTMSSVTLHGKPARTLSTPSGGSIPPTARGWYVDLPPGERIIWPVNLTFSGSGDIGVVSSIVPNSDVCTPGYSGFINVFNPFTGGNFSQPPVDFNNNGSFDDDRIGATPVTSISMPQGIGPVTHRGDVLFMSATGSDTRAGTLRPLPPLRRWRELVQ